MTSWQDWKLYNSRVRPSGFWRKNYFQTSIFISLVRINCKVNYRNSGEYILPKQEITHTPKKRGKKLGTERQGARRTTASNRPRNATSSSCSPRLSPRSFSRGKKKKSNRLIYNSPIIKTSKFFCRDMRKTAIYSQKTNYIKSEKSKYKFQKYIKKLYKKGNNREVKSLCCTSWTYTEL